MLGSCKVVHWLLIRTVTLHTWSPTAQRYWQLSKESRTLCSQCKTTTQLNHTQQWKSPSLSPLLSWVLHHHQGSRGRSGSNSRALSLPLEINNFLEQILGRWAVLQAVIFPLLFPPFCLYFSELQWPWLPIYISLNEWIIESPAEFTTCRWVFRNQQSQVSRGLDNISDVWILFIPIM